MKQKHSALFEHLCGIFPENIFFPRTENGNKKICLRENGDLLDIATLIQPSGD